MEEEPILKCEETKEYEYSIKELVLGYFMYLTNSVVCCLAMFYAMEFLIINFINLTHTLHYVDSMYMFMRQLIVVKVTLTVVALIHPLFMLTSFNNGDKITKIERTLLKLALPLTGMIVIIELVVHKLLMSYNSLLRDTIALVNASFFMFLSTMLLSSSLMLAVCGKLSRFKIIPENKELHRDCFMYAYFGVIGFLIMVWVDII